MAKFMTVPFDIEKAREIEAAHPGEYVKTVSGESVQVLTFERSDDMPIVALVGIKKTVVCYDKYGCEVSGHTSTHDLCLRTDEPVVNPRQRFAEELQALVDISVDRGRKDLAEKWADNLLELARKTIMTEELEW